MTTDRQREANRRNADKSTGPRTPEGKETVSRNAIKHGLLSQRVVLDDEDRDAFNQFHDSMLAALLPAGEVEELLASRIVASAWRLGRAQQIEHAMLTNDVSQYEASLPRALDDFARLRGGREDDDGERPSVGLAIADAFNSSDRYGKLTRYEAHIERGLYRAPHEPQRLQGTRFGQRVPLPVAVDVSVAGPDDEAPPPDLPEHLR